MKNRNMQSYFNKQFSLYVLQYQQEDHLVAKDYWT